MRADWAQHRSSPRSVGIATRTYEDPGDGRSGSGSCSVRTTDHAPSISTCRSTQVRWQHLPYVPGTRTPTGNSFSCRRRDPVVESASRATQSAAQRAGPLSAVIETVAEARASTSTWLIVSQAHTTRPNASNVSLRMHYLQRRRRRAAAQLVARRSATGGSRKRRPHRGQRGSRAGRQSIDWSRPRYRPLTAARRSDS